MQGLKTLTIAMDHSPQMILADFVSMFFVDKECCILSVVGKNQTNECIFVCVTLANDNSVRCDITRKNELKSCLTLG